MPKGQRKSKIKPLKGGAKFIREPINELIDDSDDLMQRVCDLEKGQEIESTIVMKNARFFYADAAIKITREITQ